VVWGRLGLRKPAPLLDAFLAARGLAHNLTVVSRDEDGNRNTGVGVINPFS
jgi:predicted nucleic acid-binding protein